MARFAIVYLPGSRRGAVKLSRPCGSGTTVGVMVEPSRLALTSTPSIAPSSLEDTIPVSALCAAAPPVANPVANTAAAATPSQICFGRMGHLPNDSLLWREYCAFLAGAEA